MHLPQIIDKYKDTKPNDRRIKIEAALRVQDVWAYSISIGIQKPLNYINLGIDKLKALRKERKLDMKTQSYKTIVPALHKYDTIQVDMLEWYTITDPTYAGKTEAHLTSLLKNEDYNFSTKNTTFVEDLEFFETKCSSSNKLDILIIRLRAVLEAKAEAKQAATILKRSN